MTDKLANLPPKVLQMLLLMFSPSAPDGERINAARAFDRYMAGVDIDAHEMVERITTPPVSEEDLKFVFEQGREQERMEQQRPPTTPFFSNSGYVARSVYSFDDKARVAGHDIFDGYSWADIACHCADNLARIPDQHHGFIEAMAEQLTSGATISGKQAKYLGNLFRQRLGGRI